MSFYKSGTSPNKSYLHWAIRVASTIFKETAHLKKSSTICDGSFVCKDFVDYRYPYGFSTLYKISF